MARLSAKQRAFIEEYLRCFNAAEAARKAGYSERSARSIGHENLTKPDIQAIVKSNLAERAMGADETLDRLAAQARGNMADFLHIDHNYVRIDLAKAKQADKLGLIKKVRQTKEGIEIELYDAQSALQLIGKHHGLFIDKIAPVSPDGTESYEGNTDSGRLAAIMALYERVRERLPIEPADGGIHVDPESGDATD